jgi:hypothetical protein
MAILFGSDNYPYDFRIRQLEQAFRQRQMRTIVVAAAVSALLTTGAGIGLLSLMGSSAAPPGSLSEVAEAAAAPSAEKPSGTSAERLYGCFAAVNCSPLFQNFETRPISLDSAVPETSVSANGEQRPNNTDSDGAIVTKSQAPATEQVIHSAMVPEVINPPTTHTASKATDETREFIHRARGFLLQGDIKTARLFLERAADLGDSSATFTLAETYDPIILSLWPAHSVLADGDRARIFYEQAFAAGVDEAKQRIDRLTARRSAIR